MTPEQIRQEAEREYPIDPNDSVLLQCIKSDIKEAYIKGRMKSLEEVERLKAEVKKLGEQALGNALMYAESRQEVKLLKAEVERLRGENMTHEYNQAEAERFRGEYERQICERFAEYIGQSGLKMYSEGWCEPGGSNGMHLSTEELYQRYLGEHTSDH